jgi:DNA-binding MarR family transcriptional regulator
MQRQPDPSDGRRQVISLTTTGVKILRDKRDARIRAFANVLEESFTPAELRILAAGRL